MLRLFRIEFDHDTYDYTVSIFDLITTDMGTIRRTLHSLKEKAKKTLSFEKTDGKDWWQHSFTDKPTFYGGYLVREITTQILRVDNTEKLLKKYGVNPATIEEQLTQAVNKPSWEFIVSIKD